jgi:hypothetical protein
MAEKIPDVTQMSGSGSPTLLVVSALFLRAFSKYLSKYQQDKLVALV